VKRFIAILVVLSLVVTVVPSFAQSLSADEAEANKQLVIDFIDVVFNQADVERAAEFASADYIQNTGMPSGLAVLQGSILVLHTAFPDIQYTLFDIASEGDLVAARLVITGTQEGDFMGIPATDNRVAAATINFWRVEDGLLAEHWEVVDQFSFLGQLGVIPGGAEAPALENFGVPYAEQESTEPESDTEATREVVEGLYTDVLNARDVEAAADFIGDDYVWYNPFVAPGLEGFQQFYLGIFEAFPDVQREIVLEVVENDLAFVLSTITGTHQGGEQLYGIPPTGNPIEYASADIFRVANGQIVEQWDVGDYVTLFTQIGLIPPMQ